MWLDAAVRTCLLSQNRLEISLDTEHKTVFLKHFPLPSSNGMEVSEDPARTHNERDVLANHSTVLLSDEIFCTSRPIFCKNNQPIQISTETIQQAGQPASQPLKERFHEYYTDFIVYIFFVLEWLKYV